MRPIVIVGAVVAVAVVASGGWYFWQAQKGGARPGSGDYQSAMTECQEQVFADAMEPADMKFLDGTTWHEVRADQAVLMGGKMTKMGEVGRPRTYQYQCLTRGTRVINVDVR